MEEIFSKHKLSRREAEIAFLLIKNPGFSIESIAELVFIAPVTVKTHITSIYRKCNVTNRAEFMALLIKK